MPPAVYRCYAKINLSLEVLGKRSDGYHDLASLVHTISLADDLRINAADELRGQVDGLDLGDEVNLVEQAARALAAATHVPPAAELTLLKRIPVAAGLGGGSSDAASALVGLNRLWRTGLSSPELCRLATQVGADVAFFVRGGAALMRGRGDDLEVLPAIVDQWLVLVVPRHEMADKTRRMYASLAASDFSDGTATRRVADRVRSRQPIDPEDLVNAFSRAALVMFPGLRQTWSELENACERRFHLSGAGPALFALARDRADAQRQSDRIGSMADIPAFAARTVPRGRTRYALADSPSIG